MPEKQSIKAWARAHGISEKTGNNFFWYYCNETGTKFPCTPKGYMLTADEWSAIMEHSRDRKKRSRAVNGNR